MKLRSAGILALMAFSTALPAVAADGGLDRVIEARQLRVGVAMNMPWVAKSAKGELIGYDIDLARLLAKDLGVTPVFVEMPFVELVPRLTKGDIDIVASGLAITPARARVVMFSDSTNRSAIRMVALRSALGNDPAKALAAPGMTIAALAESTDAAAAAAAFPQARILALPTAAEALAALIDGRAQAMVATAPVPRLAATLYDAKLQLLKQPLTYTPEAFAVRSGDGRLLTYLNNWVSFRRADGTLSTMQNNWFGRMDWLRQLEPETARKAAPAPAK